MSSLRVLAIGKKHMFIEFETGSGRTLLNVRHIVQVKRFQDLSDATTEIILANGGVVTVAGSYQDVCDNPVAHHDALEFPDGQVVLVTRSCDGQWQPRASRTCREGCDCGRLKWSPERLSQPRGPRGPRQGLLPEAAAFDTTDV